jgi:hypothetical protein
MTPNGHVGTHAGIRRLEDVVEGRKARWLRRLVRTATVGLFLAFVTLVVAMHVTAMGGPDEIIETFRVGHCTVSLVYRPALVLYGGVYIEVRHLDTGPLVRERLTLVDQPGDAAHDMVIRRVASRGVAAYSKESNTEVGHPVLLPDDCTPPLSPAGVGAVRVPNQEVR